MPQAIIHIPIDVDKQLNLLSVDLKLSKHDVIIKILDGYFKKFKKEVKNV